MSASDGRRYLRYPTGGGEEWMIALGPEQGPQLVIAQPLFEEMNRCRAMLIGVAARLATRGIGCWLPDLPGSGESERALSEIGWRDWPAAIADACRFAGKGEPVFLAALRGGTLIDCIAEARAHWRCAPVAGAALLRDLERARDFAGEAEDPHRRAGYAILPAMADALRKAEPAGNRARVIRLKSDPQPADAKIDAAPPWRLAEPDAAPALADALAKDLAQWLTQCAG